MEMSAGTQSRARLKCYLYHKNKKLLCACVCVWDFCVVLSILKHVNFHNKSLTHRCATVRLNAFMCINLSNICHLLIIQPPVRHIKKCCQYFTMLPIAHVFLLCCSTNIISLQGKCVVFLYVSINSCFNLI